MRFGRLLFSTLLVCATSVYGFSYTHNRRGPTSPNSKHHKHASHATGQREIDDARASEIQAALVKQGYLSGDAASGHWDSQTESAMQKLQADNGWQTKLVPDSRAIIKLGLGPNHDADQATLETSATSNTNSVGDLNQ